MIKEVSMKAPHYFYQLDGFFDGEIDEVFMGHTWELRNCTNAVRVLIHEDATPEDAIRLLKSIIESVERDPESINRKHGRNSP